MPFNFKNPLMLAILNVGADIERFASLYESFQDLTSVQVSHFVEWFSGKQLNTNVWNQTNIVGTNTFTIDDAIDEGFKITTGTSNGDQASINFNNKRHYDNDDSVVIAVTKSNATISQRTLVGLSDNTDITTNFGIIINQSSATNYAIQSKDGTTVSATEGSNPIDSSWHSHKLEFGASDIKSYFDGVLDVTKSTNLPTGKMQPYFCQVTLTTVSKTGKCRFLEAYNTSITLKSSLYERFSDLTQVLRQRVVEYFSGNSLDTNRWQFTDIAGAGSQSMEDAIDEGLQITTGTTDDNESSINFNDKRHYDNDASVVIAVCKRDAEARFRVGLSENTDMSNSFALVENDFDQTNYRLVTDDGTTESASDTESPIAVDTSYHSHKLELGASDVKLTIDGVLEVTKGTNLPDAKQQPFYAVKARSTGAKTGNIRFLESYNKLTTETDYPSYYELFQELTSIQKQHKVEWFDGKDVDTNVWTKTNISGTGTFAIIDAIDEGFSIITGSTGNADSEIDFNDKRHYDNDASEYIIVAKKITNDNLIVYAGMKDHIAGAQNTTDTSTFELRDGSTNFQYRTGHASSSTLTDTGVARDNAWHVFKGVNGASDVKSYIDGVLTNTITATLPTNKLQPIFGCRSFTSNAAKEARIRYLEVKNT